MSLAELLSTELPMNRKERFFTGTVFPMIVCADNFQLFRRLLGLLPDAPDVSINGDPEHTNIQFFTEYGLMESIYGPAKSRFTTQLAYRDTPDIIFLIKGEAKALVAFEAKMYDRPTREAVELQMKRQRELVLDYLQTALSIESVSHAALLPEKLLREFGGFAYPALTWESVLDAFAVHREDDYWMRMLRLALEAWPELVGLGAEYGKNADAKLSGQQIRDAFVKGTLGFSLMGRNEGFTGGPLENDLKSGGWRKQVYEVKREGDPPNKNWFLVSDFVAEVDRYERASEDE
jgi:hypothetical protein